MGLSEVAKLFDKSTLLQLKNECGGLQTLLRNHYYIFKGKFQCLDNKTGTSVSSAWSSDFWYYLGRTQWQIGVQFFSKISVGRFVTFLLLNRTGKVLKSLFLPARWTMFDALHQTSLFLSYSRGRSCSNKGLDPRDSHPKRKERWPGEKAAKISGVMENVPVLV